MYTIALAFLIFAGTGFTLQTVVIEDILKMMIGAEIAVMVPPNDKYGLDEFEIRKFMNYTQERDPTLIKAYSFTTYTLNKFPYVPRKTQFLFIFIYIRDIMPLSYFPQRKTQIVGVEENLLSAIFQDYYMPDLYDESISYPELTNGNLDGISGLYNRKGNLDLTFNADIHGIKTNHQSRFGYYKDVKPNENPNEGGVDRELNIVLPYGLKYEISMDIDTPAIVQVDDKYFRLKVRHMATKIPGFLFSGYRQIAFYGESLVSMPDFEYILSKHYGANVTKGKFKNQIIQQFFNQLPSNLTYNLPKDFLFISFKRETSVNERVDFANGLRNYFRDENTLLFDVITLVDDSKATFFYLELFYIVVGIIAMILSFFLILISFVSNIRENAWEFGVLRAIGLDKSQVTRIYVYEAVALIVTSGLLGTVIGIVVAITLTLQMLMFVELPFVFLFPTNMFLLTFLGGILTAIFGSYFAVREIREKTISTILKGLI